MDFAHAIGGPLRFVLALLASTNVPAGMGGIGVTTHRAIVWEVVTCRRLTFQITAGPTGGFGPPRGTSVSVRADPTTLRLAGAASQCRAYHAAYYDPKRAVLPDEFIAHAYQ